MVVCIFVACLAFVLAMGKANGVTSELYQPLAATTQLGLLGAHFIPASRMIDCTTVGIPDCNLSADRPLYTTVSPNNGSAEDIQTAVYAAPKGSVFVLNSAAYILRCACTVCYGKSDERGEGVLCRSGPDQTIMQYEVGQNLFNAGKTFSRFSRVSFGDITVKNNKLANEIAPAKVSGITGARTYRTTTQTNSSESYGISMGGDPYLKSQTVPDSLHPSAKPERFGNDPWPLTDPVAATKVNLTVTQACYINLNLRSGSTFKPSFCYRETHPPNTHTNLSATAVFSGQIGVPWRASTDDSGVAGYNIYRDDVKVSTSATNSHGGTGVSPDTTNYTVSTYDAPGNESQLRSGPAAVREQQTRNVDCGYSSNVQRALNSAASGTTVSCISAGSYTWSSVVTIPSTKNITLDGNGATVSGSLSIPNSAHFQARVTNFRFTSSGAISTGNGITNLPWRIDHCTFTGSGTLINVNTGPGLVDHSTFSGLAVAQETIHIWGWGAGSTAGWTNADLPGSYMAFYLEDNTFVGAQGNSTSAFQTYYGGRVVARYNNITSSMFDVHGNTFYSGRWWEIYNNKWWGSSPTICLRGGSGVIFGNAGSGNVFFTEEKAVGTDQVGRGANFALYPAYAWDNGSFSLNLNSNGCAPALPGIIRLNTDVYYPSSGTSLPGSCSVGQGFWKTDEGGDWDTTHGGANDGLLYKCTATDTWTPYYTPFTYPYPLDANGMPNSNGH